MNDIKGTPENIRYMEAVKQFFQLAQQAECSEAFVRAGMHMMRLAVEAVYSGTHPAAITLMCGTIKYEVEHDHR